MFTKYLLEYLDYSGLLSLFFKHGVDFDMSFVCHCFCLFTLYNRISIHTLLFYYRIEVYVSSRVLPYLILNREYVLLNQCAACLHINRKSYIMEGNSAVILTYFRSKPSFAGAF